MPVSHVRVEFNVYRGEDYEEIQHKAIDHAQNLLFEQAMRNNHELPTHININADNFIVEAWYEYPAEQEIVYICPQCSEQVVGHNKDQIRDLLAKHYELIHKEQF